MWKVIFSKTKWWAKKLSKLKYHRNIKYKNNRMKYMKEWKFDLETTKPKQQFFFIDLNKFQ